MADPCGLFSVGLDTGQGEGQGRRVKEEVGAKRTRDPERTKRVSHRAAEVEPPPLPEAKLLDEGTCEGRHRAGDRRRREGRRSEQAAMHDDVADADRDIPLAASEAAAVAREAAAVAALRGSKQPPDETQKGGGEDSRRREAVEPAPELEVRHRKKDRNNEEEAETRQKISSRPTDAAPQDGAMETRYKKVVKAESNGEAREVQRRERERANTEEVETGKRARDRSAEESRRAEAPDRKRHESTDVPPKSSRRKDAASDEVAARRRIKAESPEAPRRAGGAEAMRREKGATQTEEAGTGRRNREQPPKPPRRVSSREAGQQEQADSAANTAPRAIVRASEEEDVEHVRRRTTDRHPDEPRRDRMRERREQPPDDPHATHAPEKRRRESTEVRPRGEARTEAPLPNAEERAAERSPRGRGSQLQSQRSFRVAGEAKPKADQAFSRDRQRRA